MPGGRPALTLAVPLLWGCERHCALDEVPVRGGEDAAQDVVRAELALAGTALAPPVCVDHVRLGGIWVNPGAQGLYNTVTRAIRLDPDVSDRALRENLRHELCHAADLQNDLLQRADGLFPVPEGREVAVRSERLQTRESFAYTCQVGAPALSVLWSQECPLDPDLRGLRFVQEEVYGLSSEGQSAGARLEPVGQLAFPGAVELDGLSVSDTGELVVELELHDGQQEHFIVDPWSGEAGTWSFDSPIHGVVSEASAWPEGWDTGYRDQGGTLPDGTDVVLVRLPAWPGDVMRLLSRDGEGWRPVDAPCPRADTHLFAYEGELWSMQLDGETLSWGRWASALTP